MAPIVILVLFALFLYAALRFGADSRIGREWVGNELNDSRRQPRT